MLPGEELPSVRQLSEDLGINLHTVNKKYNILKDESYLTINRRQGSRVRDTLPQPGEKGLNLLREELIYLIADGRNRGLSREDLLKLVAGVHEGLEKGIQ